MFNILMECEMEKMRLCEHFTKIKMEKELEWFSGLV